MRDFSLRDVVKEWVLIAEEIGTLLDNHPDKKKDSYNYWTCLDAEGVVATEDFGDRYEAFTLYIDDRDKIIKITEHWGVKAGVIEWVKKTIKPILDKYQYVLA